VNSESSPKTVHLLVLSDSQDEANTFAELLNTENRPTRLHRAASLQALTSLLSEQTWDLVILTATLTELTPGQALKQIVEADPQLPVIYYLEEASDNDITKALKEGATAVIQGGNNEQLRLVANRAISQREQQQQLVALTPLYEEANQRYELLLASSGDAIAYVTDGMHIHVNQQYASLHGYDDPDELACMPFVDLVDPEDQEAFKIFLRDYMENRPQALSLNLKTLKADGGTLAMELSLSKTQFDGEDCIQFLIRPDATQQGIVNAQSVATAGGYPNLIELLKNSSGPERQLVLIGFDNIGSTRCLRGYHTTTLALQQAFSLVEAEFSGETVNRVNDETLAVISHFQNNSSCQNTAKEINNRIQQHICEIGQQTIRLNSRIVIRQLSDEDEAGTTFDECYRILQDQLTSGSGDRITTVDTHEDEHDEQHTIEVFNAEEADEQIELMYQPVVGLQGSDSEIYEVSLENRHDGNYSACASLDRWVIERALSSLQANSPHNDKTRLIIKLSQHSLKDEGFSSWLAVVLESYSIPPQRLILEISEQDASGYLKIVEKLVGSLVRLQCDVSISNINSSQQANQLLDRLKVQFIKIGKSLGEKLLNQDEQGKADMATLLNQLRDSQTRAIIPGVDHASILPGLWQLGVDLIQGDYLQAPSPEMNYEFTEVA
jgi:PAS domain S-box-containing protein